MNTDLHIINLRQSITHLQTCQKLLAADEIARMQRFVTPSLQQNFALTRGHLRLILAQYLGCSPTDIEWTYNEFGKPFVKGAALQFNLAHSGDYCAIAVTDTDLIGVDIESCTKITQPLSIAQRFFTPREAAAIESAVDPLALFFHVWTQKEAFLKAIGKGITFGLDQFEVAVDLNQSYILEIQDLAYRDQTWVSHSFAHIPGYRLTLTKENGFGALSVFG